jgi:hypothetical protein
MKLDVPVRNSGIGLRVVHLGGITRSAGKPRSADFIEVS